MKVFISYNHKDTEYAERVSQMLRSAGLEVIRDAEAMRSGEQITGFIQRALRESGVTLSLISRNSLLSAWVAMESVLSHFEADMQRRYFIPAYLEAGFFGRTFTDDALDEIEKELQDLDALIQRRLERKRGIADLEDDRQRYRDINYNLDSIIARLRGMLCIDISGNNFDAGMQKIIADIKAIPQTGQQNGDGGPSPQNGIDLDQLKKELRDLFAKGRERLLFDKLDQVLNPDSELAAELASIKANQASLGKNRYLMDTRDYNTQQNLNQQRLLDLIGQLMNEDLRQV
ncbi:MAG: TIR domain-containing protein [Bernardetiaceae bacterium]